MSATQLLILGLEYLGIGIIGAILFLLGSMFFARLREYLAIGILNNIFAVIASIIYVVIQGFAFVAKVLMDISAAAWNGLKTAWIRIGEQEIADNLGLLDVLAAGGFFMLFLVLLASDAYFTFIRLPELFGLPAPDINPAYFAPISVTYWVGIIVALASASADLFGLTHLLPPYVGAKGIVRRVLAISSIVALSLLVLAGMLFGVFSAGLVNGVSNSAVNTPLTALLFILGFVATAALGIAVGYEFLAFLVLVPTILLFIPQVAIFLLNAPIALLDTIAAILVSLYDALVAFGHGFWNWLCRTPLGKRLGFSEMVPFSSRPHITKGITILRNPIAPSVSSSPTP